MFQPVADGSNTWRGRGDTHEINRDHFMKRFFEGSVDVNSHIIFLQATFTKMETLYNFFYQRKIGGRENLFMKA